MQGWKTIVEKKGIKRLSILGSKEREAQLPMVWSQTKEKRMQTDSCFRFGV